MNTDQELANSAQENASEVMETTLAVMGLRTECMQIKSAEELNRLAKLSNNVYNGANYRNVTLTF